MAEKINSYSQAAAAANLPRRIKMEELASLGTVTYTGVRPDTATVPGTGEETEGFVADLTKDGKNYTVFIGAGILVDALARLEFPFNARIVKDGRSWVFAD